MSAPSNTSDTPIAADIPAVQKAPPCGWNYPHLFLAVFAGFFPWLLFPCLCVSGAETAKGVFAIGFHMLVLIRAAVAYQLRETGRGWMFYALLCYTSYFWVRWLGDWALGEF